MDVAKQLTPLKNRNAYNQTTTSLQIQQHMNRIHTNL